MSKSTVTRLFVGAVLLMIVGVLIAFGAVVVGIADGVVTIGGPAIVSITGSGLAGTLIWLAVAALVIGAASLAAVGSWIGALVNTYGLEDKTWFLALLVLGLFSFGWVAMVAYIFAGPDSTRAVGPARAVTL